ncbi:MAG: hypothetical protein AB2385_15685, partial [Symbiobacterium sp.]
MVERLTEPITPIPERSVRTLPGWLGLLIAMAAMAVSIWLFVLGLIPTDRGASPSPLLLVTSTVLFVASLVLLNGLF